MGNFDQMAQTPGLGPSGPSMLCLAESSEKPSCRYTGNGASEVLLIFPQPQFLSPGPVSRLLSLTISAVYLPWQRAVLTHYVNSPPPTMVKHSSPGLPGNPIPLT